VSVYSMSGPTYSGLSKFDLLDSAMSQPLSLTSTLFEEGKGGALESFGLGTLLRRGALPEEAPVQDGTDANGDAVVGTGDVYVPPNVGMRDALMGTWGDTPAQLEQRRQDAGALTEDQYKASPSFRKDIPYDPGMTETRAAALAAMDDAKKVREFYAQKRPVAAFFGSMAGQALDPINYVPVGGPLVKAAAIGRFGRIGGEALAASLDAAANTALFGIGTADARAQLGDDVSWQALISQIATAGLIGSAFGTIHGAIGARIDVRRMAEAEQRLSTLRTTMESRIALNEGIDALVRGEDVNLSPNATEPLARIAGEVAGLSRAYDDVRANPTGDVRDPLVAITPDDIEGTIVARGAFKDINDLEFSKRGWGLVKVIWGHGAEADPAKVSPDMQVRKEDITALPTVVREFEPSSLSPDGLRREWRIQRGDGKTVVYADTMMGDQGRHLVTAYIDQPKPGSIAPELSKKRPAPLPESASQAGDLTRDTIGGRSIGVPEVGQSMPAKGNIARSAAIDNTKARTEPVPEGRKQAEAAISKPEDTKALAAQHSVDPATGAFPEETEVAQLAAEGRLTPDDAVTLAQAEADYHTGAAFAEALKSVAGCVL
jgi:hypothetical protein